MPRENRKQCFIAKRLLKSQEELKQNSNRFQAPYRKKRYFEKLSERMDSSSSEDNHKFSKVKNSITLRSRQARFWDKEKTLFNQIQVVKSPNSVSDFSNDETYDNTLKRQEEKLKGDKRISKLDDETKWVARIVYNIDYNKDPIEKILAFENQSPSP